MRRYAQFRQPLEKSTTNLNIKKEDKGNIFVGEFKVLFTKKALKSPYIMHLWGNIKHLTLTLYKYQVIVGETESRELEMEAFVLPNQVAAICLAAKKI